MSDASSTTSSSSSHADAAVKKASPQLSISEYVFDENDKFYLAPPAAGILHYRTAAVVAAITEVFFVSVTAFTFLNLQINFGLTGPITSAVCIFGLVTAITTTVLMIVGILREKPFLLLPQIHFLAVEIAVLLIAAVISISSMSLGIEGTYHFFRHFVNVPLMEAHLGPIWPFNVAILSFTGAALGIWFHTLSEGCYEFLLDKCYFKNRDIELQQSSAKF